jgi:UDP-glucose 4-epimerase
VNGVNKLACEQLHRVYHDVHGMPSTILRLTNVYGPRQHLEREGLGFLPVFVRRALLGETITLFGDGTQRRDCLFVEDVVDAILLAATTDAAAGQVLNLGHPAAPTLAEIADLTFDAAGRPRAVELVPFPDELARIDIGSFQGDFSKARRLLGWEPAVTFADGVSATLDHYRSSGWSPSST